MRSLEDDPFHLGWPVFGGELLPLGSVGNGCSRNLLMVLTDMSP